MGVSFSKSSHIFFFGGLIPLFSWWSSSLFFGLLPSWPNWVEGLSPLFVYGTVYYLFEQYFWKFEIFKIAGIVSVPNLNGRWQGWQRSSYKEHGDNVKVYGKLEIKQSFSKINVRVYYSRSESESVAANFTELNDQVYLFYTYDNDPNSLKSGTMQKHKGTVKLKYLPKEQEIYGRYWNSLGNHGEMQYKFEQSELREKFS